MENKYLTKIAELIEIEKEAAFSAPAKAAVKALAPRFKAQGAAAAAKARALGQNLVGMDGGRFSGIFSNAETGKAHNLIQAIAQRHGLDYHEAGQALATAAGLGRRMAKSEI